MMESRPLARLSQVPPLAGLRQGGDLQGHRPGPEGGLRHASTGPFARATLTTHSGPYRAYGARFAVRVPLPEQTRAGWVYPVLPTRYTHPYRTPRPVQPLRPSPRCTSTLVAVTLGTCTYGRFETLVGEPRGLEYRGVLRVLTVFSTDWFYTVLHLIMTETCIWGRVSSEACGRSILGSYSGQF